MQAISIDLVIDEVPLDEAEPVTPADRIPIDGIEVCDYLVYPVENALADKACAIAERHDDRPSSRVKDLVDILVYATNCIVDGEKLMTRIKERWARGVSHFPNGSPSPRDGKVATKSNSPSFLGKPVQPNPTGQLLRPQPLPANFLTPSFQAKPPG